MIPFCSPDATKRELELININNDVSIYMAPILDINPHYVTRTRYFSKSHYSIIINYVRYKDEI